MDNASVWRARGPGIESHCGQEFFILKFSLLSRAAQRDYAIANEINRGIHLANTLFSLGNFMYLFVHLSFKLLACGARNAGFDSRSRRYDIRDLLSPASKSLK